MVNPNLQRAQEALKQLFSLMKIQRVVCVDDEYRTDSTIAIEDIIGLCAAADKEKIKEISQLETIPFEEDEELWKEHLKRLWSKLDDLIKGRIYRHLNKINSGSEDEDTQAADTLQKILGQIIEFRELSFARWKELKEALLNDVKTTGTIFLFDQDLSPEGGTNREGINQVMDLLASDNKGKVICGLLSHTGNSEEEYERWSKLAEEYKIDKDRFVFIAKERLRKDLCNFVRMIKLTVLTKYCSKLKKKVSSTIRQAQKEAIKRIENVSIYDFEHIVFRSSYREGIWEPDTLFRLHGLFQKDVVRTKARCNAPLHKLADNIRKISSILPDEPELPCITSWKIQRLELYEEGDHINSLHMPIELGDIFKKTNGTATYILLAQPCDLMVRKDGKRNQNITEVILAEVVENLPGKNKGNPLDAYYELPYFNKDTEKSCYVCFRKIHTVRLCVLDLCVYQNDGSSKISIGDTCPKNLIPAWILHFDKLQKELEKSIRHYRKLCGQESLRGQRDILCLVAPKSSNNNLFKATISGTNGKESISYSSQRIGRLCQPRAGALLTKFANYMAREAFEHDFGKII